MNDHFYINNKVADEYLAKMSGNDLKVWCAISRHFNVKGECYPSIRRLSRLAGIHHTTVRQSLDSLIEFGLLEQFVVREKCKARYVFTKSARYLMPGSQFLLGILDTKEDIIKEHRVAEKFNSVREMMSKAWEKISPKTYNSTLLESKTINS